jgi:hypothetical protein
MYHRWAALVLVLALWSLPPKSAAGQSASQPEQQQPRERKTGTLGQNYPNPFNPETFIPFSLTCDGAGGPHVVTLQIYNVLAQHVATPRVQGSDLPLSNVTLECGKSYVAWWDGKILNTGREAASGIYLYVLIVDGQRQAGKKMFVAK